MDIAGRAPHNAAAAAYQPTTTNNYIQSAATTVCDPNPEQQGTMKLISIAAYS